MTGLGDMITQARLQRRKLLDAQHRALMQEQEPQSREEFERWVEAVENVRAEIDAMERLQ
jgi:hypothetical protein